MTQFRSFNNGHTYPVMWHGNQPTPAFRSIPRLHDCVLQIVLPKTGIFFQFLATSAHSEPLVHLTTATKKALKMGQSCELPVLQLSWPTSIMGRHHYTYKSRTTCAWDKVTWYSGHCNNAWIADSISVLKQKHISLLCGRVLDLPVVTRIGNAPVWARIKVACVRYSEFIEIARHWSCSTCNFTIL